ncbi:MAG: CPBP family intramembrane metalloprotease [Clostridiales Family XIII bacterium]|jgi:membrane protease YdiL (CAAX protease family)|nr:CPBP family intramembrane metalloprotease [Clostridiales Family XIII bacterium]
MIDRYAYNPNPPAPQDENLLYRKALRYDTMMIVLMLLAFYVVMNLIAATLMIIPYLFGTDSVQSFAGGAAGLSFTDALSETTAQYGSFISLSTLIAEIVSLPIFLVIRGGRLFTTDITTVREKMRPAVFAQIFIVAFGAQFVFTALAALLNALLGKAGISATDTYSTAVEGMMNVPGLIYVMLLGPIMEEIVFRAAIMRHLEKYGGNFAIVMSAMFFGCYHIFFVQAVFAFPVGILLGYVAHKYSVKWSMLLHVLYNSAAILLSALAPSQTVELAVDTVIFIVAVVLLATNRRTIRDQINTEKPARSETYKIAFSGTSLILFLVVVAGLSLVLSF